MLGVKVMDDTNIKEVFSRLKTHMLEGMVFHDQLSQYFEFVGMSGYSKQQEYHYASETIGYRKLINHFFEEYDMLIPHAQMNRPEVIPGNWYMYHGEEVDPSVKMKAVKDGMNAWAEWETKTKQFYKEIYKTLSDNKEPESAQMVACLYMDADEELSCVMEKQHSLESIGYDINTISSKQDEIYEKYNQKIKTML